ncbi:uncharacterized protein PAC_02464 [Phialocephala subalpina]|uniref:Uncharacterized protein n=1 Tax=Phialocephala subalpina TaxID=576137 RepID=A0A1L7WIJ8_9HELO|nr:uncharacterized protein PAC_02464 [Phialocephala subalpina]
MDPRQPPQQPFSRNTASPYGRTPFHPNSNQAPFPPASHPPPAAPSYAEHNRRPSDPPYYNQRSYAPEGPPMSGGHSRHQSASSIGHGTPVNRSMPPPSSPQQQAPQQASHLYGPPPPRPPPVSVGPPTTFPSSRELPSLPPLGRPPSNGASSMSISSMLGGPPPAAREPPPSHYTSPVTTSAPPPPPQPSSLYGQSPRMTTSAPEYPPFRRPQTPEHQRPYEPRDHRANSAGSPPNLGHYSTPEARRFGTPQQGYAQRVPVVEERREPARVPNPNVPPPRPNSQPTAYNAPPPRIREEPRPTDRIFGTRVETVPRPPEPMSRAEAAYGRPAFEERHTAYGNFERERQEREAIQREQMQREREGREREEAILRQQEREARERAEHSQNLQREYAHQLAQRNSHGYSRPPEPREQPAWMRPSHEPPRPPPYERPPYEQPQERAAPPQQVSNGYEYPTTSAPQYGGPPAYAPSEPRPVDNRYGPPPPTVSAPPQHGVPLAAQYEASLERERQRMAEEQQRRQQPMYGAPQSYHQHESPQRRPIEEQQMQQQKGLLSVQEINRRGRASPLPQAVQGAQHQINGPGDQPSIKNEFGRMFSGIGSGVGAMGTPSPVTSGISGVPFSNSGQRRDDLESLQDSPVENGSHHMARSASRGGRRRKLKEEDSKGDDESSNGRLTPSGRGKRARMHNHRPHTHHHHHRADQVENISSPSQSNLTPFKSVRGSAIPSPPGPESKANPNLHHHHVPRPHVHHHVTPAKPVNTVIPLPKVIINNQAVLDSVKGLPRNHLGHGYYHSTLTAEASAVKRDRASHRGFASTPQPLPRFEGRENCTFTVKIPSVYLDDKSREEITARKALWGTDIYTDDSDVIAACIHQGWFRGKWHADIDESLLDLDIEVEGNGAVQAPLDPDALITAPPPTGPMHVPANRDCHVTILILPLLRKYGSLTRFGIRSREWGVKHDGYQSVHDGLSFMIQSIRWVKGVDNEEGRKGKERRSIFSDQLNDREMEDEEAWGDFFNHRNADQFEMSYERGSGQPLRMKMGIGTGNWLSGANGASNDKGKQRRVGAMPEPIPAPVISPLSSPIQAPALPAPTPPIPTPATPQIRRPTTQPLSPPIPEPLSPIAPKTRELDPSPAPVLESPPSLSPAPVQAAPPAPEVISQPVVAQPVAVADTTLRDQQIERVTKRMIENANMASPATGTPQSSAQVVDDTPSRVLSVPVAEVDIKNEQAAEQVVPVNGNDTPMSG